MSILIFLGGTRIYSQLNRFTLILGCLLLVSAIAVSQRHQVSGIVVDAETKQPMPLIGVSVPAHDIGSNTNLEGYFSLYLPAGEQLIVIKYSGYQPFRDTIQVDSAISDIRIELQPVSMTIGEVEISDKYVNPAIRIVRNAIKQKKYNRMDKIEAYEYEAYTKLVMTLDNLTSKFLDHKLMRGVGDVVRELGGDSAVADSGAFSLAAFISESISRFYFKKPGQKKEEILAVQTSGVRKDAEFNLLSTMFLQIDIYENSIPILGKGFVSPVADGAFMNYDYELITTEIEGRDTLFGLKIVPKREFDPVFRGTIYIDNEHWAVNRIDLEMSSDPNINWVEDIRIRQQYDYIQNFWVPVVLDLEVDFVNSLTKKHGGKNIGVVGRTSSYLYNYKINQPREAKFYNRETLEIMHDAGVKDSTFWDEHRRSPLDQSERLGFALVDSIKHRGIFDFYIEAATFIKRGVKEFKYFSVGPYFYVFGFNQAEGPRFRLGLYTLKTFSKKLYLGGHLAYGLRDQRIKYQVEGKWRIVRKPKLEIGFRKTFEVEQVGFADFLDEGTSLLETMLRRVPLTQLNYYHEHKFNIDHDISRGLTGSLWFRSKSFAPASTFPFHYHGENGDINSIYDISEVGVKLRLSFKEVYITVGGDKRYVGTEYPVFHVQYQHGFKGLFGSDFEYKHGRVTIDHKLGMGRFGFTRYQLTAGQIFGTLPFPELHVFGGNQTWALRATGFNMMNYYEFIADRYATVRLEHHFQGIIWKKLPLLRKLKLKEVFTARAAFGTLTPENKALNTIPAGAAGNTEAQNIVAPDTEPYVETGFALENILKVLRVDFIWRLNYQDALADRDRFRNFGKRNNFGLRFHMVVRF